MKDEGKKRLIVLIVTGTIVVGGYWFYLEREKAAEEQRILLIDANYDAIQAELDAAFAAEIEKHKASLAEIDAREGAWNAREAEDKKMKATLSENDYLRWRVDRNRRESAQEAYEEKRKAEKLQEDTLKELQEINRKLGK